MISLTPQQQKLLSFIGNKLGETGGVAPSFSEMAKHMGFVSRSNIYRLLGELEERGRILRLKNRARAIEIVEARCPHCGKGL